MVMSYSLGGDHTIVLPILRSLNKVYGPVSVIHFDAHLDTWPAYPGPGSQQSRVTHCTFFYLANEEGLMTNTSIHAGIRCKLAVRLHLVPGYLSRTHRRAPSLARAPPPLR